MLRRAVGRAVAGDDAAAAAAAQDGLGRVGHRGAGTERAIHTGDTVHQLLAVHGILQSWCSQAVESLRARLLLISKYLSRVLLKSYPQQRFFT